ncbi:2Fe-2S iron-sulfur cluster-binding protein [Cupriavidus pauculus]|uniref:2Fe-2S iron-sulfur cluster-binding protein n=1 Tax=Cupriavidus pauculus TaxID=82633 RepID=UPI001FD2F520|nr:2Fe-2S iron-sulfur cluster binding domain-containing protein [Cupriavidus pauculus]
MMADTEAGATVIDDTQAPAKTPPVEITFVTNQGKTVRAPHNSNLLRVSLREQGGIPFKCGGGICGTCKCRIEQGLENTDDVKPKERKHLNDDDLRAGYRMACQTFIKGDVAVSWEPRTTPR